MSHPTFGISVNLMGLTFPIPEEDKARNAPGAAHSAQHMPSPRAAGPSPAQPSRAAQPPCDACLGPCGKPVGSIQVLAGRYPCVSELLPARTGLGRCQARAGRGPLRSCWHLLAPAPCSDTVLQVWHLGKSFSCPLGDAALSLFHAPAPRGAAQSPRVTPVPFPLLLGVGSQQLGPPFSLSKGKVLFSPGRPQRGKETKRVAWA